MNIRRWAAAISVVAVPCLAAASCDPVASPDGTAQVTSRVDMAHTGVSKTVLGANPSVRWRHSFGSNAGIESPLIVGDLVVAPVVEWTDEPVETRTGFAYVVAFDRASGEEQWRTPALGEWPTALGLAAGGGRVFAADYAGSTLTAIDLATGALLWTGDVPTWPGRPPVVAGNEVYVSTGGSSDDPSAKLWSFDARTGAVRWKQTVRIGGDSSPAVAGDAVYVSARGATQAMRRSDGRVLWHREDGSSNPNGTDVIVRNGRVYAIGTRFTRYPESWRGDILSQETGAKLETIQATLAPAVGTGNFVYVNQGNLVNRTVDGVTVRWRRRFGSIEAPVIAGQTILGLVRKADPTDSQAPGTGALVGVRVSDGGEVFRLPLGAFPEAYLARDWSWPPRVAAGNHTIAFVYGNEIVVAG